MENHKQADVCFGAYLSLFLPDINGEPTLYQALNYVGVGNSETRKRSSLELEKFTNYKEIDKSLRMVCYRVCTG